MSFFFFLAIVMFMRFYHRLNMEKKKKRECLIQNLIRNTLEGYNGDFVK